MKHLGDITKINGADVPPVNVIIGGSPCQDLSVAGRREGLKGERSGLFIEQIRIIKEMRSESERNGATDIQPRYMVWENVPGAFSSNKGQDFKAVLEETIGVVEKENKPDIPIPEGGWHYSGCIVGDGFSVAWRVFDAQFWGVPQRRRRIALVADFGGTTAPEILFECKSVSGDITQSGTPWKDFASAIAKRFGSTNQAERGTEHLTYCIQGNSIDRADTAGCNGKGVKEGVSYTLNTIDRPAVYDYDRRHDKCQGVEVAPTVTAKYGTGGGNTPLVYDARGNGEGGIVPTITGDHQNRVTDYTALCVRERCGCEGGGKGCLIQNEKSGTLAVNNDQFVCSLDRASFNQGVNAQYDPKISEDGISSTLTAKGPSAVCFNAHDCQSKRVFDPDGVSPTLASGGHTEGMNIVPSVLNQSTVRRLTPLECERLQGFPDNWTQIGELIGFEECEDELGEKWKIGIYEYIDSNGKKRKTSDSARYRALGNSIALPSWVWVLERLSYCCGADRTMASLFDGIGGFPLIWETLNGKGTCLWASEIEEFPIAVTNYHFNKGE